MHTWIHRNPTHACVCMYVRNSCLAYGIVDGWLAQMLLLFDFVTRDITDY